MKKNNFLLIIIILFLGMVIGGMITPPKSDQERIKDFETELQSPNDLDPLNPNTVESNSLITQIASGIGGLFEQVFSFIIRTIQTIIESFVG